MKIYINNKVYVNRKDIYYVLTHEVPTPDFLTTELQQYVNSGREIKFSEQDKNEFMEFQSDKCKDYFSRLDYILNYGSYAKYDIDTLNQLLVDTANQRFDLIDYFKSLDEREKIIHLGIKQQIDNLNIFIRGLHDLISLKEGKSDIVLPKRQRKDPDAKYKQLFRQIMQPINHD